MRRSCRLDTGVLLYPSVDKELNEIVGIHGHQIHFRSLNLALPWQEIEKHLDAVVAACPSPPPSGSPLLLTASG
jgi:hypothetical protein